MRILYVAMKYDYGKPERGYGFEHYNFYHSLLHMGNDILYFDFMSLMQKNGKEWMNRRLVEVAKAEKPDLMFSVLFTDQFEQGAIREVSENTDTITLNWFCDDHWRFDDYSRHWAPYFNWVVTTANSAVPKYGKLGYTNVIKSQWGCNHFLYRRLNLPLTYDVSFIGQPHGDRPAIIRAIQNAGIKVNTWGTGWGLGRLSQDDMIKVFNQSRINLNLSNASVENSSSTVREALASKIVNALPFSAKIKPMGKLLRKGFGFREHVSQVSHEGDQIKGRNFEVPGCGGFLLSGKADDLDAYYDPNQDIAYFADVRDLIGKVKYYLAHEEERTAIAQAGYQRTLREHTYTHRFAEIFNICGLPCQAIHSLITDNPRSGQTEDIQ